MRDILVQILPLWAAGQRVALATVVDTYRSAPRPAGASMVRQPDGAVVGSISGGCVEGAVYEIAGDVLVDGVTRSERYGITEDDAFAIGLTCGGILDVVVSAVDQRTWPDLDAVVADIAEHRPVATVLVIDHPDAVRVGARMSVRPDEYVGTLGSDRIDQAVAEDARGLLAAGASGTLTYGPDGQRLGEGMTVFVASFAPAPRMLVFGAIDFASALARQGQALGHRVTVCDARGLFATPARFPGVDDVVVDWPHRYLRQELDGGRIDARSAICVLTHDPKFDVPALQVAFEAPEGTYIGAMGSRQTHLDRLERLRAAGVSEHNLRRLHSPIGLDLGARTPQETAVSIVAEIIATQWGGDGSALGRSGGAIHHEPLTAHSGPPGTQRRQPMNAPGTAMTKESAHASARTI